MAVRSVRVVLLGVGNVGAAVARRLLASGSRHRAQHNLHFEIAALVDSSGCVLDSGRGLPPLIVEDLLDAKEQGESLKASSSTALAASDTTTFIDEPFHNDQLLESVGGPSSIVVDCTALSISSEVLIANLGLGGGAVLANKKPVTGPMRDWHAFNDPANRSRVGFESTVGAGTPFVSTVERLLASGDRVAGINGMLSGTLGYLTSGLEEGNGFSAVVRAAFENGFTEPDPRDDLSGMDVARKALILGRMCGVQLELANINVEALFPASMSTLSVPDFLSSLDELDETIAAKAYQAEQEDKTLRFVASVVPSKNEIRVGLEAVSKKSGLGRLTGTGNIVEITTKDYTTDNPLVVSGSGAGASVTAAGVIADMVRVASALE